MDDRIELRMTCGRCACALGSLESGTERGSLLRRRLAARRSCRLRTPPDIVDDSTHIIVEKIIVLLISSKTISICSA